MRTVIALFLSLVLGAPFVLGGEPIVLPGAESFYPGLFMSSLGSGASRLTASRKRARFASAGVWIAGNARASGFGLNERLQRLETIRPEVMKSLPYAAPAFQRLMNAVTMHVSFDADSMQADMAEGPDYAPSVFVSRKKEWPKPQFDDGLVGRSLKLGTGGALYPRTGNVLLEKRGAVAVWIQPQNWQRPRDGNCVFTMTSNASFYLERQGPDIDDDGRVRRHEGILYIAKVRESRSVTLNGGSDWQNDRWYLLVANWSWPTMELSVNGQPFKVRSLSKTPTAETFGNLVLGDRSGELRGLLDEFFAFRRPLALDEVQLLWGLRSSGTP